MRWCGILFAAGLLLAASSAQADGLWNGPGWYVVATQDAVVLWSGPYENQDECELQKPTDGEPRVTAIPARISIKPPNPK